jgi:hypothetical protein
MPTSASVCKGCGWSLISKTKELEDVKLPIPGTMHVIGPPHCLDTWTRESMPRYRTRKSQLIYMMRYLLINVQKSNKRPNQPRPALLIYMQKVNAPDMRVASSPDNLMYTRKCDASVVLAASGNTIYCCLPLFCAAGPISLLKAMYETSRPAMADTPTQRITRRSRLTVRAMKMPRHIVLILTNFLPYPLITYQETRTGTSRTREGRPA